VTRLRVLLIALLVAWAPASADAAKLKVVASFSILADMASRIGASQVEIHTLVGSNGDTHAFQPTPADAKAVAQADVIVLNGLGFEAWSDRLIRSSAAKGAIIIASTGVKPRKFGPDSASAIDPHAWQDLRNGQIYAHNIAEGFAKADKANAQYYRDNAEGYIADLALSDAKVRAAIAAVPADRRKIITSHDAFGYFGAAYGVEFIAPLGISTEDQASAKGVARLIDQIKAEHISAIFVENITDPRLINQIASETGVKVGGELFSDALSKPGGEAATYTDMFGHNREALVEAMTAGEEHK
jgi:zinc/manganese transport system substrate-binding protein